MRENYDELKTYFRNIEDVVVNDGKGAQGIKYNGKMFAMFHKGDLLLKFSPKRVLELIDNDEALPHDPGTGKTMKDRVLVPVDKIDTWIRLTEESLAYVRK